MITTFFLVIGGITLFVCGPQLLVSLERYRMKKYTHTPLAQKDMPTVSVCIPARNETHALSECLESVLASDYPKLEVIVLDDCSHDKTSELIKSFAHDGVRFVQGDQPAKGWLGRNYASSVLAREASGEYMLFLSVDTLLSPTSVSRLVGYTVLKHASMVSVLPRRRDNGFRPSVFLSTLRYFFPMAIPQLLHTPVSPAAWLVHRHSLEALGGFQAHYNAVLPESSFARTFDERGAYRYIVSDDKLGIYHAKKWRSQVETSIRLSYPTLSKSPMQVMLAGLLLYGSLVVPYIVVATSLLSRQWDAAAIISACIVGVYTMLYLLFTARVWKHGWILGAIFFPLVALQEIALIVTSMIAYMTGRVEWKGRNICYPVLRRVK